jgi:hypothetical protein
MCASMAAAERPHEIISSAGPWRAKREDFAHHFVKPIEPGELDRVLRETIRHIDGTRPAAH